MQLAISIAITQPRTAPAPGGGGVTPSDPPRLSSTTIKLSSTNRKLSEAA